jgi:hypothetical protein
MTPIHTGWFPSRENVTGRHGVTLVMMIADATAKMILQGTCLEISAENLYGVVYNRNFLPESPAIWLSYFYKRRFVSKPSPATLFKLTT